MRNHGRSSQGASDLGRAISSREHSDRERTTNNEEFSEVELATSPIRKTCVFIKLSMLFGDARENLTHLNPADSKHLAPEQV